MNATNTCYQIVDWYKAIQAEGDKQRLRKTLSDVLELRADEARLALVRAFDDAIDEISHIPTLTDEQVSEMIQNVRGIQGRALTAVSQDNLQQFNTHAKTQEAIQTLTLIGHTVNSSGFRTDDPLDREALIRSTERFLGEAKRSNLNQMQKDFLALKLSAILRTMQECEGLSDTQIRRKLKNIFADIRAELDEIEGDHRQFAESCKEWVSSFMTKGLLVVGLTADAATIAALTAPPVIALVSQMHDDTKLIEGPPSDSEASASGE